MPSEQMSGKHLLFLGRETLYFLNVYDHPQSNCGQAGAVQTQICPKPPKCKLGAIFGWDLNIEGKQCHVHIAGELKFNWLDFDVTRFYSRAGIGVLLVFEKEKGECKTETSLTAHASINPEALCSERFFMLFFLGPGASCLEPYSFTLQVVPSLLSLITMFMAASSSRMRSLSAQFLLARASLRRARSSSTLATSTPAALSSAFFL